jgi:hypothetical protein
MAIFCKVAEKWHLVLFHRIWTLVGSWYRYDSWLGSDPGSWIPGSGIDRDPGIGSGIDRGIQDAGRDYGIPDRDPGSWYLVRYEHPLGARFCDYFLFAIFYIEETVKWPSRKTLRHFWASYFLSVFPILRVALFCTYEMVFLVLYMAGGFPNIFSTCFWTPHARPVSKLLGKVSAHVKFVSRSV